MTFQRKQCQKKVKYYWGFVNISYFIFYHKYLTYHLNKSMGCLNSKDKQINNLRNLRTMGIEQPQYKEQVIDNQKINFPQGLPLCKIDGRQDLFNSPLDKSPSIDHQQINNFLSNEDNNNPYQKDQTTIELKKVPMHRLSTSINQVKQNRLSLNDQEQRDSYGDILRNLKNDSKKLRGQRYSIQTLQQIF
ncbi:hypothetical protein pb186bvf_002834 [Paramecium bursaria]